MITKAVIPAAGLGTRLLPVTKETPKEMLPIYVRSRDGRVLLKPILQVIFENLFDAGFREFCFIVGRGKRAIEDHFTPDYSFLDELERRGKLNSVRDLKEFYRRIEKSTIVWVNQPFPRGFGDAVLKARTFVGDDCFLVHAGDALVFSNNNDHLSELLKLQSEYEPESIFLLKIVDDPRSYGVIEVEEDYGEVVKIKNIIEKPEVPPSKLAVIPIYVFDPIIFKALKNTPPGNRGEIELTDAIEKLIKWELKVYAVKPKKGRVWIDVGTPENYWMALNISYKIAREGE